VLKNRYYGKQQKSGEHIVRATYSLSAIRRIIAVLLLAVIVTPVFAQDEEPQMIPAPDRQEGEGEGPFERLIIRGATLIDGTGAPPIGPVDIVI
jgi:hypothetical protein